ERAGIVFNFDAEGQQYTMMFSVTSRRSAAGAPPKDHWTPLAVGVTTGLTPVGGGSTSTASTLPCAAPDTDTEPSSVPVFTRVSVRIRRASRSISTAPLSPRT